MDASFSVRRSVRVSVRFGGEYSRRSDLVGRHNLTMVIRHATSTKGMPPHALRIASICWTLAREISSHQTIAVAFAVVCLTVGIPVCYPIEGETMNRDLAARIKEKALAAVEELTSILDIVKGEIPAHEFEQVKKGVGLAIGSIEMHVNAQLYRQFPDLES
jgi:hypothetical protein